MEISVGRGGSQLEDLDYGTVCESFWSQSTSAEQENTDIPL